jgi:hypothetical protein
MANRTNTKPASKTLTSLSKEIIALSYRGCEEIIFGGEDAITDALALLFKGHLAGLAVSKADLVAASAAAMTGDEEAFCEHFEAVARRLAAASLPS